MIGRRSVWSDDRIIEFAKNFVPCTDEVYRLQQGKDPDCKYFQTIAKQGHYKGKRGRSQQGIYVCSADGTFLASINSNSADAVLKTLEKGISEFAKLPKSQRATYSQDKVKANFRWERYFPVDGLALAVYSKDLPEDLDANSTDKLRWNRDAIWYHVSEIRDTIPKDLRVGDQFPLPEILSRRLLMMNLVDTVRGQTDPFEANEVAASVKCVVNSVSNQQIVFTMSGEIISESQSTKFRRTPRGIVAKVSGAATFSFENSKFETFDMVAVGYRWGRTRFNGRHRGPNYSPIGFAVSMAPADEDVIVPGLIYAYERPWLGEARGTDGAKR